MYGVPVSLSQDGVISYDGSMLVKDQYVDLLGHENYKAQRTEVSEKEFQVVIFRFGEDVVVVTGRALRGTVKHPAFETKYYGPCRFFTAKHPVYALVSTIGRHSRKPIHARRLVKFFRFPFQLQN